MVVMCYPIGAGVGGLATAYRRQPAA